MTNEGGKVTGPIVVPDPDVHSVMDTEEGTHSMMFGPLADLRNLHADLIETIDELDESDGDFNLLDKEESSIHLEFFTVAHSIIENRSAWLLHLYLIEDRRLNNTVSRELFKRLPQRRRAQLLTEIDVSPYVDGEVDVEALIKKMKRTVDVRNKLAHNPYERRYLNDSETVKRDAGWALEAATQLDEIMRVIRHERIKKIDHNYQSSG